MFWVMMVADELVDAASWHYLASYDPDACEGRGDIKVTRDIGLARRFADAREVLEEWRRQSTVQPLRSDGKPNRPLTAYTIQPKQVP